MRRRRGRCGSFFFFYSAGGGGVLERGAKKKKKKRNKGHKKKRRRRKKSGDELFLLFFLDLENVSFVFRFPKKQLTGRVVDAKRLLAGTAARGDAPKGLARAAERKLVFCFGFSIVMVMGSTTAEP